jgi:hypothetical protein
MTKTQLINKLKDKFTTVLEDSIKQTGEEEGIKHWAIPVIDIVNDAMLRQWVHFYTDADDKAFWQDREPKSDITPVRSFTQRAQEFIDKKIGDNTVKFGVIKELNEAQKKATVTALMPDKTTKTVLLTETAEDNFDLEVI